MTAFAQGERDTPWGRLVCEIRSVNHRHLDASFRLPETLRAQEPNLRARVRERVDRGKLECSVRLDRSIGGQSLEIDHAALTEVLTVIAEVRAALGTAAGSTDPAEVLRWPGIVREPGIDPEAVTLALGGLLEEVLDGFIAHREREGMRLAQGVQQRLLAMEAITERLKAEASNLVAELRVRLRQRASALAAELAPERLEQEVVLLAQRADVAEELERLETHIIEMRQALGDSGPVGRRLDFLAQELNREANTLASKATRAEVASETVELKVLIEQIREQIQNLE